MYILPISSVNDGKVECKRKKDKTVTPSKRVHAKGETSTFQRGKLSYNAVNINVLVLVYAGAELLESSISRLSLLAGRLWNNKRIREKNTNIIRKFYQSSRFNDKNPFRK